MPAIICFVLLFLLPFLIAPFGTSEFEIPKVIVSEAGILCIIIYALFIKKHEIHLSIKYLLLYSIIGIVTVFDLLFLRTNISFFGNEFRMQGIFLLWLLLLFSLYSSEKFANIAWYWYGLLLFIESVVVFFLPLNASQRFVGTLGEPNALGAFVIFLWPFAFFGVKKFGILEKICCIIIWILVMLLIFLSGSKSALTAFLVQLLSIFLYKKGYVKKKIIYICLIIYISSYIFPFFENNPYENRVEVWRSAIAAGFSHPFFGNGFGNIEYALHTSAKQIGLPIQYYYVDSSHNIFLDWWVQGGIIGLSIIVTLIYLTMKRFISMDNMRELTLFIGMLIVLSFNPASVVGLLGFWWLIGQGLRE